MPSSINETIRKKLRADQIERDGLLAKLLQTQGDLKATQRRVVRTAKDHEKIVEEHVEYESIIHRIGGQTISEVEQRTTKLLKKYVELKRVCGPGSPELMRALDILRKSGTRYKVVLK